MHHLGLEVVEMKHTLAGTEYIYNHPEKRAEDLMNAFSDNSIKAIIACIIRLTYQIFIREILDYKRR